MTTIVLSNKAAKLMKLCDAQPLTLAAPSPAPSPYEPFRSSREKRLWYENLWETKEFGPALWKATFPSSSPLSPQPCSRSLCARLCPRERPNNGEPYSGSTASAKFYMRNMGNGVLVKTRTTFAAIRVFNRHWGVFHHGLQDVIELFSR
jgi:hypothetical protein